MFFNILKEELERKGITLNKLAKSTGIAQSATDRWKHGSIPNADVLIKICKYLNVSADYLLELEPKPPDRLTPDEEFLIALKRIYSNVPITNTRNICSYINTSQILLSGSQVEQLYMFLKQYTHTTQVQQQQHIYDAKHPYLKRIK